MKNPPTESLGLEPLTESKSTEQKEKVNEDEMFTDSTDTEDFYDAVDSTPVNRGVQKQDTRKEEVIKNTEENEFVIVDHPRTKEDSKNENHVILTAPKPSSEQVEREQDAAESDGAAKKKQAGEPSTFETIFGVQNGQEKLPEDYEEEPVLVSSLSESEISDPFTTSANSSTHRVAPPPPQSRKPRAPPVNEPSPANQQKHIKKPPAPPPTKSTQSHDFDAIFGTPVPSTVNNETINRTLSHELDESEFDEVFNVTPNAEKAVPTAVSPFQDTNHSNQVDFDNAFNVPLLNMPTTSSSAFQGFQDSFDQSTEMTIAQTDNTNTVIKSPPAATAPTFSEPLSNTSIAERGIQPASNVSSANEINNKPISNTGKSEPYVDGSQGVLRGVDEDSRTPIKKEEVEDDGKKKKKKKNIISLAKSIGFKKKKDKKEKAHENKPSVSKENTPSIRSPTGTTSFAASNNSSGIHQQDENNFAYDLDTIQGSHIAELVNMGFEPAAALDALDRYDQDLELATNFLLDQSSR